MTESLKDKIKDSPFMGFFDHLDDLRGRLIRSIIAVVIASLLMFNYADALLKFLIKPVGKLIFTSPADAFLTNMYLSFFSGFVLVLPYVLFEFWQFVASALKEKERSVVFFVCPISVVLFLIGASFAYFLVIPYSLKYLLSFSSDVFVPMITAKSYLSFVGTMVLGFGVTFEMPLILYFLARIGIATPAFLEQHRKYAVVIILIISAVVTPPDLFSMIVMAVPLLILYEISLLVIKWTYSKKNAQTF